MSEHEAGERGPVDFVVGEDFAPHDGTSGAPRDAVPATHASTERLAEPAPPRRTRLGVLAVVAVLALVVVGVIVHGRSDSRPTARPASPSSTPTTVHPSPAATTPSPPAPVPGQDQVFDALPSLTEPPVCPQNDDAQTACYRRAAVPTAFRRAVHDYFPQVRQTSADTQVLRPGLELAGPGLWSRAYGARGDGLSMQIYVRRGTTHEPINLASLDDGAHTTVFSEEQVGKYVVQVQIVAVSGADVDQNALLRLASDFRLVDGS